MEHRMNNHKHELENGVNVVWSLLAGLLVGGLVGAGTMLVLAPQSGKETRAKIQQKTLELRDQTTDVVEDVVAQAGVKGRQFETSVRKQAKELEQRGQAMLAEQKKRWSPA